MMYKTVYKEVEIDVDLQDFDTDDLLEELEERGELPLNTDTYKELVEKIWMARRNGRDYQSILNDLIYDVTGQIV